MRILVTGAAGFIGANIALELERLGHCVVGLDDLSVGRSQNLRDFGGDFVAADLAEGGWESSVGKVSAVFHEAAITDTTILDEAKMMRANVEAFRKLLAWSAKSGVKKIVYASSAGVYGNGALPMRESAASSPHNVYAFSKKVMERVASDFAKSHPRVKLTGLRYFNVFGPRERHKGKVASMILQLAGQMRAGKRPRIFEFGEQYRDHIYVKDVVAANLKAWEKSPSGVFNVCTGKKTTFNEIIRCLNETLGTDFSPEYFKNPYAGYQDETLGDPSRAVAAFGFRSRFTVAKGIEDYLGGRKVPAGV